MDLKESLAGCFLGELGCSNTITHLRDGAGERAFAFE